MGQFKPEWRKRTAAHCFLCGADFMAVVSEIKRGGGKFCSRKCQRSHQARVNANEKRSPVDEITRRRQRRATEDPRMRAAHGAVEQAIQRGDLVRDPCVECGEPQSEGHHEDYDKPLDVVWLCRLHHRQRHKVLRKVA